MSSSWSEGGQVFELSTLVPELFIGEQAFVDLMEIRRRSILVAARFELP